MNVSHPALAIGAVHEARHRRRVPSHPERLHGVLPPVALSGAATAAVAVVARVAACFFAACFLAVASVHFAGWWGITAAAAAIAGPPGLAGLRVLCSLRCRFRLCNRCVATGH